MIFKLLQSVEGEYFLLNSNVYKKLCYDITQTLWLENGKQKKSQNNLLILSIEAQKQSVDEVKTQACPNMFVTTQY